MSNGIIFAIIVCFLSFTLSPAILDGVLKLAIQNAVGLEKYLIIAMEIILGLPTDLIGIILKFVFWISVLIVSSNF